MTNDLAKIFTRIESASAKVEELASQILESMKEAQADTLEDFNEMVGDAYEANGWSRQAGRPAEGSTTSPAPMTIRNYVSIIRRGYKLKLKVLQFSTLGELRKAIKDSKVKRARADQVDELAALRGVKIAKEEAMIGAEVHDIGVVLKHLDTDGQAEFVAKLQRLLRQYSKRAHLELVAA